MSKIRIFRCWETPDILRQLPGYDRNSPNNYGYWAGNKFICEEDGDCDYAIILNRVGKNQRFAHCPKENVWAVFQEPYIFRMHDWMIDDHSQFAKIFTHHIFNEQKKYVRSYPMLAWYVDKTYDELSAMQSPPQKTKSLSWVTSKKGIFPGHRERLDFLEIIENSTLEIDLFGSGINFIENKWDAMAEYKYAMAVENTKVGDYWTEKLADSFLAFNLPFYYGADNIESYFPKGSFIRIDIHKPEEAIEIIRQAIADNEWEKRLPDILKARELVLEKYNFFAHVSELIESDVSSNNKSNNTLRPYNRSLKRRLLNVWEKILHALNITKLYR